MVEVLGIPESEQVSWGLGNVSIELHEQWIAERIGPLHQTTISLWNHHDLVAQYLPPHLQ